MCLLDRPLLIALPSQLKRLSGASSPGSQNGLSESDADKLEVIDIGNESDWIEPYGPSVLISRRHLKLRDSLLIFACVYGMTFIVAIIFAFKSDATFKDGIELVRFLLTTIIPLVTLAVGYYLGNQAKQ